MTAVAKLLPCPFCGDEPTMHTWSDHGYVRIECKSCNFEWDYFNTTRDATESWNLRAALSPAELGGVEAVAQIELNGLSMSGLVYTKHGLESSLSDGTKLYTQAALNAEYARGRCDGFDAALSTPRAAEAVTDELIETFCLAAEQAAGMDEGCYERLPVGEGLRAVFASLTPPSAKGE